MSIRIIAWLLLPCLLATMVGCSYHTTIDRSEFGSSTPDFAELTVGDAVTVWLHDGTIFRGDIEAIDAISLTLGRDVAGTRQSTVLRLDQIERLDQRVPTDFGEAVMTFFTTAVVILGVLYVLLVSSVEWGHS